MQIASPVVAYPSVPHEPLLVAITKGNTGQPKWHCCVPLALTREPQGRDYGPVKGGAWDAPRLCDGYLTSSSIKAMNAMVDFI